MTSYPARLVMKVLVAQLCFSRLNCDLQAAFINELLNSENFIQRCLGNYIPAPTDYGSKSSLVQEQIDEVTNDCNDTDSEEGRDGESPIK